MKKIFYNIVNENYEDVTMEDVNFLARYLNELANANFDSNKNSMYYEILQDSYLEEGSPERSIVNHFDYNFNKINEDGFYHSEKAYSYCAESCNYLFKYGSGHNERYAPSIQGVEEVGRLSGLSRLIIYTELRSALRNTNFVYRKGEEPAWWLAISCDNNKIVSKIDEQIDNAILSIKMNINNHKSSSK